MFACRFGDWAHGDTADLRSRVLAVSQARTADELRDRTRAAAELGVNSSYLGKIFRLEVGQGFGHRLNRARMVSAQKLLLDTSMKAREVAVAVGYSNTTYFLTLFKRRTGFSPSEYRRRFTNGIALEGQPD